MKKWYAGLLCGAVLLFQAGCSGGTDDAQLMDTTIAVETAVVTADDLQSESFYVGTISTEGTVSVVAMVSGNVDDVSVSVGDTVSAGALLCRFDDESARLNLASAQASFASAQASYGGEDLSLLRSQLASAQENYDNAQIMLEMGAVSQQEVEQTEQALESAQAALSTAQAGLQAAQTSVDTAEYQLSLYQLTAPISGVVEAVNVTAHNFISSGSTAFVIANGSKKTVTFYVADAVRQDMLAGQLVTVSANGSDYSGAVTEISGVVDPSTGLFQVKAQIENARDLSDGLTVAVSTVSHRAQSSVLIPTDALYYDAGNAYVFVIQDSTAVRTDVEVALYTTETAAISSGLTPGTEVITSWAAGLKDGAAVKKAEDIAAETAGDLSEETADAAGAEG